MKFTRKQLRQMMMVQMLPHMLAGHPIAAILSRLGFWRACEWWHYFTLPSRAKQKISKDQLDYCHHPDVFMTDFVFAPGAHLLGTLGLHYIGFRFYMLNPFLNAAIEHSTHFNFLLWGNFSKDSKEREEARRLMTDARCRRAKLVLEGHPRYPHITMLPDPKETFESSSAANNLS